MEVGLECWGVGEQIAFQGDVWREECHGGVSIVGHGRCPCDGGQFQVRSVPTCRLRNSSGSRVLRAACPPARRRRSCCLVARVMCRPWPLAIGRALASSRRPRSPHVITGSDARGEAAGPARRNLEERNKQSAMRPATESALLWWSGPGGEPRRRKTWDLFIVFAKVFGQFLRAAT